jgi:hypothetical protein
VIRNTTSRKCRNSFLERRDLEKDNGHTLGGAGFRALFIDKKIMNSARGTFRFLLAFFEQMPYNKAGGKSP